MAPEIPLDRLTLSATSLADDLGFVAFADLAIALKDVSTQYRIIGGHMMTGLVTRWGLGADLYRATGDTDFGASPVVLRDLDLTVRLSGIGYIQIAGDRFEKPVTDIPTSFHPDLQVTQPNAYIDVLVPAYTSRARNNKRIGNSLVLTEAHGLADALLRPPIQLELEMHRLNGEVLRADLSFADEVSALVLKASTTQIRSKDTDIVDIWRCLEICNAAQIGPDSFLAGAPAEAADVVRALFSSREGAGIAAIASSQNLSVQAADIRYTRISALVERTFGLN